MTTLVYQDAKSHKFWTVEQHEQELHLCWGKVGSQGQSRTKSFANADGAALEKDKLIKEKQKKGYVIEEETHAPAPHVAASAPVEASPVTQRGQRPPWLLNSEAIPFPENIAVWAFSHRLLPTPTWYTYKPMDKAASQAQQQAAIRQLCGERPALRIDDTECPSSYHHDFALAQQHLDLQIPFPESSPFVGAILAEIMCGRMTNLYAVPKKQMTEEDLMDALVDGYGLNYVIELFIHLQQLWSITNSQGSVQLAMADTLVGPQRRYSLSNFESRLRFHLTRADEALWQRCAQRLVDALPLIPCWRRPIVSFLLPEKPELADLIVEQAAGDKQMASLEWLKLTATHPDTVAKLNGYRELNIFDYHYFINSTLVTLLREHGIPAIARITVYHKVIRLGDTLSKINHPDALTQLLKVAQRHKDYFKQCTDAIAKHPHAAMAALAELLSARKDKDTPFWNGQLIALIGDKPHIIDDITPWISAGARNVIKGIQQQLDSPDDQADESELPTILTTPPWLAQKKKVQIPELSLPPLAIEPVLKPLSSPQRWINSQMAETETIDTPQLLKQMGYFRYDSHKGVPAEVVEAFDKSDYESFKQLWRKQNKHYVPTMNLYVLRGLPRDKAIEAWTALAGEVSTGSDVIMYHFGLDALEGFIKSFGRAPQENMTTAMNIGAAELAPRMARAFNKLKTVREEAKQWILTYPEHTITGVLPDALGSKGEARDHARAALLMLANEQHEALIRDVAARYAQPDVIAALNTLLALDPLDNFPTKRPALPAFYSPQHWQRPCLHSGKVLPDTALEHIGTMLRFPVTDGLYPGLEQVKAACTPDSLAAFAWSMFSAWLSAGAPAKDNWAFTALGIFGNDETARQLTPMIRIWPGESQHKRAVTGLEILAQIGTDIALMQLNGIAQKLKFKGLREKAREKIAQIAEQRELTVAELEDRLAPDLGLDERGSMLLDFGPRQFTVSFDETLKPFVRDTQGKRLKDLPRPNKSDDAELSAKAVDRYKALKKDARAIAAQQVQRLESAMCQQRRWTHEQFRQFLVEHPLVGHLTRRLVWATYDANKQLTHCFRVAEDNTYSTADDDEFQLPENTALIGLPHRLEIPEQDIVAFGQLFTDYELLPPFSQLDRACYALTKAERKALILDRWRDKQCPSGRLAGLANKGWQRGTPQDAGWIGCMMKQMGDWTAIIEMSEGFCVGLPPDEFGAEQTVNGIGLIKGIPIYVGWWNPKDYTHTFSVLNDVAASELLSDIEALFT